VCGTGDCIDEARVCDDFEDCQNGADEDPAACEPVLLQSWRLTDGCDDGQDVRWRLWAEQRDWVWPTIDTVFVTGGLDRGHEEVIECIEGERICFGATSGDLSWGIGADGDRSCEDCCFACDGYAVDVGTLGCP
jgi:hypothetical protein